MWHLFIGKDFIFLFKKIDIFLLREGSARRGRGGERICTDSAEPDEGLGPTNRGEIKT